MAASGEVTVKGVYLDGLYLFKSLIKDGCEWHGDVVGPWSECLYYPEGLKHQVDATLAAYQEGVNYKREPGCVWIK